MADGIAGVSLNITLYRSVAMPAATFFTAEYRCVQCTGVFQRE